MIHSLPSHHDIFMRYCGFFFLVISYFSWSFLLEIYQFYSFFNKATFMFALLFCSIDFCLHLYYLFLDIYFRGIFFNRFWDNNVIFHFKIFFFINLFIWSYVFLLHTAWIALHEFWFFLNYCLISLCVFFLLYWRPIDYLEKVLLDFQVFVSFTGIISCWMRLWST